MGLMMCRYAPCYTADLSLTTANGAAAYAAAACCDPMLADRIRWDDAAMWAIKRLPVIAHEIAVWHAYQLLVISPFEVGRGYDRIGDEII